ncbi:amidohydrolase family protein [Gemmatimonadota bacterium]
MTLRSFFIALLALFLFQPANAQTTAIRAGQLLDPATGQVTADQVILVEDGRITGVGPSLEIPDGALIVDLSDLTVLPGLIDAHTHMSLGMELDQHFGTPLLANIYNSTPYRAIRGVIRAREMLEAGFTTIRDVGNAADWADLAVRRAISEGLVPGPTMLVSGKIIAPYGGQGFLPTEHPWLADHEYLFADTRDELTKAIRLNAHQNVDVIKIVVDDQPYVYSVEDLRFIVAEAANAGLKVAAHCMTERGARNAAEAGIHSIEHGWVMSDETMEVMKRNDVTLVTTEFTAEVLQEYNIDEETSRQMHLIPVERMVRAHRLGIRIAFGSDLIMDFDHMTRGEAAVSLLDSFVESGVPPESILYYMITEPARLLGMEGSRGAIDQGHFADIVATESNPLEDIHTLKSVRFVMKEGVIIKQHD